MIPKSKVGSGCVGDLGLGQAQFDLYGNFRFRVKWGGKIVAGANAFQIATATEVHRRRGDDSVSRGLPGRAEYDAIVLERGVAQVGVFGEWADLAGGGCTSAGPKFAPGCGGEDIELLMFDEAGRVVLAYKIYSARVIEILALSNMDEEQASRFFQSITLTHEGFELDADVGEPVEP